MNTKTNKKKEVIIKVKTKPQRKAKRKKSEISNEDGDVYYNIQR